MDEGWEDYIVFRSAERIVTQAGRQENGRMVWQETVNVYYVADPPTRRVPPAKIGLPPVPERWEPIEGRKPVDKGPEGSEAGEGADGRPGYRRRLRGGHGGSGQHRGHLSLL